MKAIITIILTFTSWHTFACINQVPESEAIRYNAAAKLGEGVAPLYTCEDKPNEACLCFDHCEGWDVCEVKEVEEIRRLTERKFETIKVKKLVNNLELMQARARKQELEANHREIVEAKRALAREKLRSICTKSYMSTVAKTGECVDALLDFQVR
jgi:hypothetical protein